VSHFQQSWKRKILHAASNYSIFIFLQFIGRSKSPCGSSDVANQQR
jgi:hypothetical protein